MDRIPFPNPPSRHWCRTQTITSFPLASAMTPSWNLDLAYDFIYRERRHIHNDVNSPIVDGTWDNQFQGLMLTLTVKL